MIRSLRRWISARKNNREAKPRPFTDTPEANDARRVIPGETREQARARLEKYRK